MKNSLAKIRSRKLTKDKLEKVHKAQIKWVTRCKNIHIKI